MFKKNEAFPIVMITTGGTIEKVYNEFDGSLKNSSKPIGVQILSALRLPYTDIQLVPILAKDSLEMTDSDRQFLKKTIDKYLHSQRPVVVLHGTDSMRESALYCYLNITSLRVPVIFTGAMRPFGFVDSDATQNVTEALIAAKFLGPGIYVSFHGKVFSLPNVRKNKKKGTFEDSL